MIGQVTGLFSKGFHAIGGGYVIIAKKATVDALVSYVALRVVAALTIGAGACYFANKAYNTAKTVYDGYKKEAKFDSLVNKNTGYLTAHVLTAVVLGVFAGFVAFRPSFL